MLFIYSLVIAFTIFNVWYSKEFISFYVPSLVISLNHKDIDNIKFKKENNNNNPPL